MLRRSIPIPVQSSAIPSPYQYINHSFAASFTSPIFNLGEYFFNTPSLWYYNHQHQLSPLFICALVR